MWVYFFFIGLSNSLKTLGIDLGQEFYKVGLASQSEANALPAALDIVLNASGGRKTPLALSLLEATRKLDQDAIKHAGRDPTKVFQFLGHAFGGHPSTVVLPDPLFYPYELQLDPNDIRLKYEDTARNMTAFSIKELYTHVLKHVGEMDPQAKQVVLTVPSDVTQLQRRMWIDVANVAGLKVIGLIGQTAATALRRGMDHLPENPELTLFYNLGASHLEVCLAELSSQESGMVAGRKIGAVSIKGCRIDRLVGGAYLDQSLARHILALMKEKHPEVEPTARVRKRVLTEANRQKLVLSTIKSVKFQLESFGGGHDFRHDLERSQMEEWWQVDGLIDRLTNPVTELLGSLNTTIADLTEVELVGGAWRVPKVLSTLKNFFPQTNLSTHLNGEEAAVMGATHFAANVTKQFRIRRTFFQDIHAHTYGIRVYMPSDPNYFKSTILFEEGSKVPAKKVITLTVNQDLQVELLENDKVFVSYQIKGVPAAAAKHTEDNCRLSLTFQTDSTGIVALKKVEAEVVTLEAAPTTTTTTLPPSTSSEDLGETTPAPEFEESPETTTESPPSTEDPSTTTTSTTTTTLKRVVTQVRMELTENYEMPMPMTSDQRLEAKRVLKTFTDFDENVRRLSMVKNSFESLMYSLKEKLEDDEDWAQVLKPQEIEDLKKVLQESRDWFESQTTREITDFTSRTEAIEKLMRPINLRLHQKECRSPSISKVDKQLQEVVQKSEILKTPEFDYLPAKRMEAVVKRIQDFQIQYADVKSRQSQLADSDDPVYFCQSHEQEVKALMQELSNLEKFPKPRSTTTSIPQSQEPSDPPAFEDAPTTEAPKEEL